MQIPCREWNDSAAVRASVAALGHGEVQVWLVPVPDEPCPIRGRTLCLSRDEGERAGRFRHALTRSQFITGRVALRQMLGSCLRIEPATLAFSYQPSGKPYLDPHQWQTGIRFNLSHSKSWVAIALAQAREVGVDIEAIEQLEDWHLLADRVFSAHELDEMNGLTAAQRGAAFYRGWTRKEAYLKATGEGLIDDLGKIRVSLLAGEPAELRGLPAGAGDPRQWTMRAIPMPTGYEGAVVFSARIAEPGDLLSEPASIESRAD